MTALLIFQLSAQKTFSLPLEEATITLGRAADNTAQIDESSISRHHARLTRRTRIWGEEEWTLEDLQSANGSRRNGVAVTEATTLRDGDALEFGVIKAVYRASPPPAAKASPASAPGFGGEASPDPRELCAGVYRLETPLGEGPGYRSYRAQDTARGRTVSLKLFDRLLSFSDEDRKNLTHEIGKLQAHPHPNIVAPQALESDGPWTFLASEWTAGVSLLDVLRRRQALTVRPALLLLQQAAAALDHAREHDLPRLDLNPRAALLTLAVAATPGETPLPEPLLKMPPERWPPFLLKLTPVLAMPQREKALSDDTAYGSPASEIHIGNEQKNIPFVLGALFCELLGYPLMSGSGRDGKLRGKAPRIASLGEEGNEALKRGLTQPESFQSGQEFCAALG